MLTKDQVFAVNCHRREWLPLPDLTPAGETHDPAKHGVYIGTMTVMEYEDWERAIYAFRDRTDAEKRTQVRAVTVVYSVRDADGNRLFTEDDIPSLNQLTTEPLQAIFDVAVRLNKLLKSDANELAAATAA